MADQETELLFDNPMSQILVGLQWDANPAKKSGGLKFFMSDDDLDLSAMLLGANGGLIDFLSPGAPELEKYRLQILHTGDQTTGETSQDDEELHINLDKLDPAVASVVFFVTSKSGRHIDKVENPHVHFLDSQTYRKFLVCDLRQYPSPPERKEPFAVAALKRGPAKNLGADSWTLKPLLQYTGTDSEDGWQKSALLKLKI